MKLRDLLKHFDTKKALADSIGLHKQSVSNRDMDRDVPEAWLYRLQRVRPDIFDTAA